MNLLDASSATCKKRDQVGWRPVESKGGRGDGTGPTSRNGSWTVGGDAGWTWRSAVLMACTALDTVPIRFRRG